MEKVKEDVVFCRKADYNKMLLPLIDKETHHETDGP